MEDQTSTATLKQALTSATTVASSFQTLCSSRTGVLTSQSLASWLDPRGVDTNIDEDKCGIGYLSAHPVSVSVKGPCYEREGINGIAVPLGTPVRVGHRANAVDSDCESDASGPSEPEGQLAQEGESSALSRASRSFDVFGEFVDLDPLFRFVGSVRMSHRGSIRAARRNVPTLKIRARRGHLFQGEAPFIRSGRGILSPAGAFPQNFLFTEHFRRL